LWWRPSASLSRPASALRSERYRRSALPTAWSATGRSCQTRSSCAARLSGRRSASEAPAGATETGLAGVTGPLESDAPLREAAAKTGILIAAADCAVHKDSISRSSFSERALIVGRSAFRLLPGFLLLALFASLIVKTHLLERATARAESLSCPTRSACARRLSGRCRAILASPRRASTTGSATRKLPAAKSAPAARVGRSLSWSLRTVVATGGRRVCRRICGCCCACRNLAGILRRGRRSFDARERRNLERHVDRARSTPEIKLLRGIVKTDLAYFDSVVPCGQSRQIEVAVFIGPTDPGPPARCFDQTKICAGNGHAI
jgi:hypothetical protein